jgi:hypothetical protein
MTEPAPESPSKGPDLTADELVARIEKRRREMEVTPCYRCDHSPAAPEKNCACCFWAHTPLPDGTFKDAA